MAPYYRIELENFEPLPDPVPLNTITITYETAIRNELQENKPKFYPFCIRQDKVCTVEGIYLAYCTTNLYNLLKRIVAIQKGTMAVQQEGHKNQCEYVEGVRKQGEIYFFSRNSQLAKKAKEHYGYSCCICGFNFEKAYGDIGKGYIECHHLNPLSGQNESEWPKQIKTTIDDVVVVCANCHRMIHSKRPSYSVKEIKESFLKNNK